MYLSLSRFPVGEKRMGGQTLPTPYSDTTTHKHNTTLHINTNDNPIYAYGIKHNRLLQAILQMATS